MRTGVCSLVSFLNTCNCHFISYARVGPWGVENIPQIDVTAWLHIHDAALWFAPHLRGALLDWDLMTGGHSSRTNSLSRSKEVWDDLRRKPSKDGCALISKQQVGLWLLNSEGIDTKGPKVNISNTLHHQQPELLIQVRTEPCFYAAYAKFWSLHPNAAWARDDTLQ